MQFLSLIVEARSEVRHAVSVSADRSGSRISAGDDFAEYGQVRVDAKEPLGAVYADPEARDDLVADEKGAVLMRQPLGSAYEFA